MTHDGTAAGLDGSAAGPPRGDGGPRRFQAGAPPRDTSAAAKSALTLAALVVLCSWATLRNLRAALVTLNQAGTLADTLLVLLGIAALWLLIPAWRGRRFSVEAHRALANDDLIGARVASASARTSIWITFGYAAAQVVLLLFIQFFIANDLAVSRTFFLLPQIASSFW